MGFDREGGKKEKMQRVNLSPFPHSLFISSFSVHLLAARLAQLVQPCCGICQISDQIILLM